MLHPRRRGAVSDLGRLLLRTGAVPGIVLMLVGVLLFATNDALGKWLVASHGVGQLLLVRSIGGLLVMAPFICRTGPGGFRRAPRRGLQALRVAFSTAETALFFWALGALPLAEVMTYYMAGPIYVTALSPFLLGERVGWRRWTAVAVGFAGVLLALHPSPGSITPGALAALAGSFFYACFLLATRKLAGAPGAVLMTGQLAGALLFGAALVAAEGWQAAGPIDLLLMLLLGVGSLAGNLCVTQSLRIAPASVVVPYQYTLIVWGILFGWIFFGEVIGPPTALGAIVIVGSGLFIFLREQQVRRRG